MAKFKEKVKLSENTLGQLIASDEKASNSDGVSIDETQVDGYTLIKSESDIEGDDEEEQVTESYEEVEFLDLQGQSETSTGIQFVTMDKCDDDDEFIDEIIEECSVEDGDLVDIIVSEETVNVTNRNVVKVNLRAVWANFTLVSNHFSITEIVTQTNIATPKSQRFQSYNQFQLCLLRCWYRLRTFLLNVFLLKIFHLGFMHSSNLKKHMSTHGSDQLNVSDSNDTIKIEEIAEPHVIAGKISRKNIAKPHKCEHCDRAFVSRSLLSSHIRTHTGER